MKSILLILIPVIILPGSLGVTIQRMSVPKWVQNGTEEAVTLDCEYRYTENDFKLVVKWFFNNTSEPVYQWIPEMNTREAYGILQNRLDLEFSVNSRDDYSQYRAIRIKRPTVELSGRYTCDVSSLAGQDSREQSMTVYVPARSFVFNYTVSGSDSAKLKCTGEGLFPVPELKLFLLQPNGQPPRAMSGVRTVTRPKNQLYDVELSKDLSVTELPFESNVLECVLEIPYSTYSLRKRLVFSPELTWGLYGTSKGSLPSSLTVYWITTVFCIRIHFLR